MRQSKGPSEAATRAIRIDPRLEADGWTVVPLAPGQQAQWQHHAVAEYPTSAGPADYALFLDGQLVGIVEAKATHVGPQSVLTQAERYAKGLSETSFNFRGLRAPFLYSTNGEQIWHHDVRDQLNQAREIARFHSPAALREQLDRHFEADCAALAALPNTHDRLRPYQRDANDAVEKAIAGRKRRMLVAMATGTGKTFTLVNQSYRLMKTGVGRRILFLVDRRALAAQAVQAFASFEAEPNKKFDKLYEVYSQRFQKADLDESQRFDPQVLPASYLTSPRAKHAFVYVCTIQRMAVNLFGRADSIEQRVADATARANALTQATLAKAFRGELVPTEAELER
jgi:type I restriction enzyme, R subunit